MQGQRQRLGRCWLARRGLMGRGADVYLTASTGIGA
jgi:hypothetical protein